MLCVLCGERAGVGEGLEIGRGLEAAVWALAVTLSAADRLDYSIGRRTNAPGASTALWRDFGMPVAQARPPRSARKVENTTRRSEMMRKTMVVAVVVAAVAGFRAGASAQAVPAPATHAAQAPAVPVQAAQAAAEAPATQAPSAASLLHPSPVGAELLAPAPARAGAPERQMVHAPAYGRRNGLALMIAGGAAFLGGAIIGGDAGTALMVGGVVVGAVGLYQYLQ